MKYFFTNQELEKWKRQPDINPRTGYKINEKSKNGVFHQLQEQYNTYKQLCENTAKCSEIPLSIVANILSYRHMENESKIYQMTKHIIKLLKKDNEINVSCQLIDNDDVFVNYMLISRHLNFGIVNCISEKQSYLKIGFCFKNVFKLQSSCLYSNFDYTKKYDITSTFWKNIKPFVEIEFIVPNKDDPISMNCSLTNCNGNLFLLFEDNDECKKDFIDDDGHPLLKYYRECLRICFKVIQLVSYDDIDIVQLSKDKWLQGLAILSNLTTLPFVDELEDVTNEENQSFRIIEHIKNDILQNQDLSNSIRKLNTSINVEKNIENWNVNVHGLLNLKFNGEQGNNLHKHRLHNMLNSQSLKNEIFK